MNTNETGEEQKVEAPTDDIPESESQEQTDDQQEAQPQESPETETGKNDQESEVPKDNAAWAKMRTENKRLREVVDNIDPEYLESLRYATSPQQEIPREQYQPLGEDAEYNQVTGTLNRTSQEAQQASARVARLEQQLEIQQDREAERAYPQLKSDKVFQQIVAEKKLAARVLGRDTTTMEIAEEVDRLLKRREEQVEAKTAEATKQQIAQRQAISSEPKGRTTSVNADQREEQRMRVRRGVPGAEAEVAAGLIADLEF